MNNFPLNEPLFWEIIGWMLIAGIFLFFAYITIIVLYGFISDFIESYRYRGLPKPIIDDPVFGEIQFDPRYALWEGFVVFKSDLSCDTITIEADVSGPTDAQRSLYQEVEKRYPQLLPAIEHAMRKDVVQALKEWSLESEDEMKDNNWELSLYRLDIPTQEGSEIWMATYFKDLDEMNSISCEVTITDWEISDVETEFVH